MKTMTMNKIAIHDDDDSQESCGASQIARVRVIEER
jgi:hypothetical protein